MSGQTARVTSMLQGIGENDTIPDRFARSMGDRQIVSPIGNPSFHFSGNCNLLGARGELKFFELTEPSEPGNVRC